MSMLKPMKRRRWLLGLGALFALGATLVLGADDARAAREAAKAAFAQARRDGFRLELREFPLTLTPTEQARASVLTNTGFAVRNLRRFDDFTWMTPVVLGAARCGWHSAGKWAQLAAELKPADGELEAAIAMLRTSEPLRLTPRNYGGL
jgi:hypothetical protein